MKIRMYEDKDYLMIQSWWKSHRGAEIERSLLSDVGVVVYNEKYDILAAWGYLSNSKLGQIGWPVSNPVAKAKEKINALILAIQTLEDGLRENGCEVLQMISDKSAITKCAKKLGWTDLKKQHDVIVKKL